MAIMCEVAKEEVEIKNKDKKGELLAKQLQLTSAMRGYHV